MGRLDGEPLMASAYLRRLRALSGVLDQLFSSISNGVIIFAVAVVSPPQQFGHIAILMTALVAVMGCLRGALGTPLLLKSDQSRERIRREGSYALTASFMVGPLLAATIIVFGSDLGIAAVILGIASPFVLAQDVLRYVAIAEGRPYVAALWDGIWCAGSIALLVLTWSGFKFVTVSVLLGGWGLLAAIAFFGLLADLRVLPRSRGSIAWIRAGLQHRIRYGVDAGLEQVTILAVLTIVSALTTTTLAAALRGATALLAPIGMFGNAIQLIVIPESTRRSSQPKEVWRLMLRIAIISAFATSLGGFILCMLPTRIGFFLLGDSWELSQRILPVTVLEYVAACFAVALAIFLRTFNRSADALALRIALMVAVISGATLTAVVFQNAIGVAIGIAMASVLVTGVAFAWFTPWQPRARAASVDIAAEIVPHVNISEPALVPMVAGTADQKAAVATTSAVARWPVVLASLMAALVAVSLYNAAQPREHTATMVISFHAFDAKAATSEHEGDLVSRQRAQTYANMFKRDDLAQTVIDWLGLSESPRELVDQVSASVVGDTVVVAVSVENNAQRAANIANAYGAVFGDYVTRIDDVGKSPDRPPLVTVVKSASAEDAVKSGSANWVLTTVGAIVGLSVGFGLAWYLERVGPKARRRNSTPMPDRQSSPNQRVGS